ncbi:MAG: DUF6976 family protein [Chromatiales bacterium]
MGAGPQTQHPTALSADVNGRLVAPRDAAAAIERGRVLWLAGDEALLRQLPRGRWIGGSIPYFVAQNGGQASRELVFCAELPPQIATAVQVRYYDARTIGQVAKDAPDNGFSILLIPATSEVHLSYAQHAPGYEDMFLKPIAGWVTGVHLDDLGKMRPTVFNGVTGDNSSDRALVMHVTLKPDKVANIGIVNTFTQGTGDAIEFPETGFSASTCRINGVECSFAQHVRENNIDLRLPLVADYSGTMINVSLQQVDERGNNVSFYAPVFRGVRYRFAAPVDDYVEAFYSAIPHFEQPVAFSCNCVLNYLYSGLHGKKTAQLTGPATFGEIAYQLLNQTLVYLLVEEA